MGLLVGVYYMNTPSQYQMANNDIILYIHLIRNMDNRYLTTRTVGTPTTSIYNF